MLPYILINTQTDHVSDNHKFQIKVEGGREDSNITSMLVF